MATRRHRAGVACLLAAGVLLIRSPLCAQSRERARDLANSAADAIARGEHHAAERLLEQAYREYPAPTIALLHARTLVQLRRLAAALAAYQRASAISLSPSASEAFRRSVEEARHEAQLLEPRVPRLLVAVLGPAATRPELSIELDGEALPRSQLGRWTLVDPGRRVVRAELGHAVTERSLLVEEGQSSVVEIEAPSPSRGKSLTLAALGVGAVGLGAGIALGVMANSAHDAAQARCDDNRCIAGSEGARQLERFRTLRVYSTVGYAVSALGLGAGGYLLLRGSFDPSPLRVELERVAVTTRSTP